MKYQVTLNKLTVWKHLMTALFTAFMMSACGGDTIADTNTTTPPTPTPVTETDVFIDTASNLMWQDDVLAKTTTKPWLETAQATACNDDKTSGACTDTSGDTAATFCTDMTLNSHTDWRLPTTDELNNLYFSQATSLKNLILDNYYWTSVSESLDPIRVYSVKKLTSGALVTATTLKSDLNYIRCVRGI